MRKRLFPSFVYTRPFGWALLLLMVWLAFKGIDVLHGLPQVLCGLFLFFWFAFLLSELLRGADFLTETRDQATSQPSRCRAYLVVHLDVKQSPPVATFVCIYSSSARDLTSIGGEAHADLYSVECDSYHEASEEMERIAPLYFPWVVPLLKRYQ